MSRYTTFKHWLFDKNKRPYYVDSNGNVVTGDINTLTKTDGQPACLEHAPTGWSNTLIKYGRNNKYLGVIRDFSVPLRFVNDAAKIIKQLMWNVGFEAQSFYGLSKLDRYIFPPKYEAYYLGEIDLSKLKQDRDAVEVSVLDGGVMKYLKAYENTTYEIGISDDPEAVTVYLDGFPFKNKIEWTIYENQQFDGQQTQGYVMGMGIIVQEGTTQGVLVQDQMWLAGQAAVPGGEYLLISDSKSFTANITGSINIEFDPTRAAPVYLRKRNIVDGISTQTNYLISNTVGLTNIQLNEAIPMEPNDHLYLTIGGDSSNPGIDGKILSGNLKLEYEVRFTPTFCKGLKPFRLFEKLVEKMTDGKHSCNSDLLKSMDKLVYSSGMAIRNNPGQDHVIKISFSDFFKSLQRFGVMMGVENEQLIIEPVKRAFSSDVIVDLGTVNNLTIDVAEDMVYNTIKCGYRDQTYDEVNGLDEFNVTQQWTTPILKITKELDLISPVRADMYGIEITRLNLYGKDTTDSGADNDTFFLSVEQGALVVYYDGPYKVVDGKIRIAGIMENVAAGTILTVEGMGDLTVANISYLVVGYTTITFTTSLTNGDYSGSITYSSSEIYKLYRPAYSAITGVLHPDEAFNTELTPKQALLNNGAFIHSFLEDESGRVKFQSGEKNSELSTTLSGVTLTQKEDVQVSDLSEKLFKPYYFSFETEVPVNFLKIMKDTPYGTVQFNDHKGNVFYGYMWDGSIKPATNDKQKWKLLCTPQTDLTKLI